jgi:UDP:flavonoid glycosyltransferase YjiC (YdhE family)
MRVMITGAVPSHVMPMVPLAWALRALGHEVVVAGKSAVTETARTAGLCTMEVTEVDPGMEARRMAEAGPAPAGPPSWDRLADNWRARVGNVVESYLEAARAFGPDLVVTDPIEYAGPVVARILDLPYAVHRWGPEALTGEALPLARRALAGLCERLGAAGPFAEPAAVIDPCPPGLQDPTADPATHPVRFVPFNGPGAVPVWPRRGRHRVCLSLGMFGFELLARGSRTVIDVLAGHLAGRADLDVVLPVPDGWADRLAHLPDPVRVVGRVPLAAILGGCTLVLHHGGSGTALTAAAFGLPQLVMPQEHPALAGCAERLVRCGVARTVGPDTAGEAIDAVLAGAPEAARARALRAELDALPSPVAVAENLTALVAGFCGAIPA